MSSLVRIAQIILYSVCQGNDGPVTLGFLHLRNVEVHLWDHKGIYRIYCVIEQSLRIKPRKRLKRDVPDALAVHERLECDLDDGVQGLSPA